MSAVETVGEADALVRELDHLLGGDLFFPPGRVERMWRGLDHVFSPARAMGDREHKLYFDVDGIRWHICVQVGKTEACYGFSPTTFDGHGWASAWVSQIEILPSQLLVWIGHSRGFYRDHFREGPWWGAIADLIARAPGRLAEANAAVDRQLAETARATALEGERLAAEWVASHRSGR